MVETLTKKITFVLTWKPRLSDELQYGGLRGFKLLLYLRLVLQVGQGNPHIENAQHGTLVIQIDRLCQHHLQVQTWRKHQIGVLARGDERRSGSAFSCAVFTHQQACKNPSL